jgi:hypothetical protein
MNNTVFVVIRTLSIEGPDVGFGSQMIDALPVVEGVFTSYKAANDFVDPLLDSKDDVVEYSIIERELK